MSSPTSESGSSLSFKYWLGPYAIVISTLYLWGYWGSFHVNVLEYISVTEIVKAAVYPITSVFAFFAIGAVLGEVASPTLNLPPGEGANTEVGKWVRRIAPFFVGTYLVAVTFYFLAGPVEKWHVLPVLFAIAVYLPLKSTRILLDELKSDGARSVAVFLLAALVPFAYGRGVLEANDVLTGKKYAYAATEVPGQLVPTNARHGERPRYVGKANDRYVFFDPVGKSISLVATSEVKALVLKRHELDTSIGPPTSKPADGAASAPTSRLIGTPASAPALEIGNDGK
jgi:hypothetical protein